MKVVVWVLAALLPLKGFANGVGNGTDPLRFIFEEARPSAAFRVMNAEACAFGVNVSSEVRNWILAHKDALADDIKGSQHVWLTDSQTTCAYTMPTPRADITLSFVSCRPGIRDISDAVKVLVHESVHHFGITDEYFADKVAEAIYNLGNNSACPVPPAADPFDPSSCPGAPLSSQDLFNMIPLPSKNEITLGNFNVHSRMRTCYSKNLCTAWEPSDIRGFYASRYNVDIDLSVEGHISLQLINNSPVITMVSKFDNRGTWWSRSSVVNYKLISTDIWHVNVPVLVGDKIQNPLFSGWLTKSCLRQTASGNYYTKDNHGNDIVKEYETVLLSRFNP
jgi:hypothetical protein